jgi:hypothetical protein
MDDSLDISVEAPVVVRPGDTVDFTLVITNRLDRSITLYLQGREITFDLVVRSAAGDIRWRRLEGQPIPAILKVEPLAAKASLRLRAKWDQRDDRGGPIAPGEYSVEGLVLTDGPPLTSRRTIFRIAP